MKKQLLITLLLFIGTMNAFSQLRTVGTDSERNAEYKKAIGLDMTIPDFDTNKIDAQVMGSRLANLLNYLLENYHQESYELQLAQILSKQNENLQHLYYKIKKMQFANASKQGDIMTITMNVWPDKNQAGVNQTDMIFRFFDGASDDQATNALFSYMSRYVEAQEAINLQMGGTFENSNAIVTNTFWDNWYLQFGMDMALQNPYGTDFSKVFPNGKSFGIDVAVGKWFSPDYGARFKVNWGNGIFKNDHNTWLSPFGEPGANHDGGGYVTFTGDIQFNLHNLLGTYRPERKWNFIVAPRAGGWIDIGGRGGGAPIMGLGLINTYRLSDRWRLYADVSYMFTASINARRESEDGSNGYAEINIGVEMDLSKKNKFHRSSQTTNSDEKSVAINSIWDNWFAQAGFGMSLINPYGTNFANVFPNGKTFGINLALGKWFTPEAGLRVGMNWQNGIFGNAYASYLDSENQPGSNKDKHGFVSVYGDFFLNLHNIIEGYDYSRKWNAIVYPRLGIVCNFSSRHKKCPVLGMGTDLSYKIQDKVSLFADLSYQVTTGGFLDTKFSTGASCSSNGWFDLNFGIQYEFGRNWWDKPDEKRRASHWEGGHNWPRFMVNTIASVGIGFGVKTVLKKAIKEERPDGSDNQSFPSGHATMAFAAARSIDKEFRKDCIWIPIAGYAAATAVGIERIANKRHHWYDVLAGAAIGIGSAELTWWLSDLIIGKGSNVAVGTSGNTVDVAYKF